VEYIFQLNECTSSFASAINKGSEVCKITSIAFGMCVLHQSSLLQPCFYAF
jgi:hypothetical protein